ncbi:MAG TPA: VanZ family protein, partial [Polyangiales bacterium]|nr:VanZ family protein [Polyangiales bacterium]
ERGDLVLNLLLLLPAGFLYRLWRRGRAAWHAPACSDALLLGLTLSFALESAQRYLPTRCASAVDVLANGAGAWLGASLHARVAPWLDRRLSQKLALELPLMQVLYLLVPLLFLDSLARDGVDAALSGCALAVFAAAIAAALHEQRLARALPGPSTANRWSLLVASVFAAAIARDLVRSPGCAAIEIATCALATRAFIARGLRLPVGERRFEAPAIARALPWLVLYLASSTWLLPVRTLRSWDANEVRSLLAAVAAFTLFGYLVGELCSRVRAPSWQIVLRGAASALLCALVFGGLSTAGLRGYTALALLLTGAGAVGTAIHRAQIVLVRGLRAHTPARASHEFPRLATR